MDCRMFLYYGDAKVAMNFQNSLKLAAKKDIFNNKSHGDGWGSVILSKNSETYIRRSESIYNHDQLEYFINSDGKIAILSHARLASETEQKRGWIDVHPFRIFMENETLYIAHNGYIDKKKLEEGYGIKTKNFTDSESFAYLIQRMDGDAMGNIKEIIDFLHKNGLAGTLNLLCLGYRYDGKLRICYYSDFITKNENYSSLIEYHNKEEISVMSSTVAYYLNLVDDELKPLKNNVSKVEKGKFFKMEADL